ncbi:MAG: hypothetical protein FK732_03615 [Asgard group archaeon]|nr:hypothetical protein [Asgard group archaeon]
MVKIKELPFDDTEDPTAETIEDSSEATPEELEKRSNEISSSVFKRLGIIIMILSFTILPLTILSFFYHPSQPDETSLLIQQIVGFVLFGVGAIIGSLLLVTARKMKKKEDYILEVVAEDTIENE